MNVSRLPTAVIVGVRAEHAHIEVAVSSSCDFTISARTRFPRDAAARASCALQASGVLLPPATYTCNLVAGAWVPGGDRHFDLPLAIAAVLAAGRLDCSRAAKWLTAGELALDGTLRPIRGAVLLAMAAREMGLAGIIVPRENGREAALVQGIDVRGADSLAEVIRFLGEGTGLGAAEATWPPPASHPPLDLADVKGQEHVKRALEVAAAGSHNLLLVGPPGGGKTMLAQRLPGILPPLTHPEALELTGIYSAAGLLHGRPSFVTDSPFRNPHSTISDVGLIGGGAHPRPGEASLAHRGVLFLDELPEFRRNVLEALRRPLGERRVVVNRTGCHLEFPANHMLVASMSPCPCGYLGDSRRRCTCSPRALARHRDHIPAPLLDRIEMHVEVPAVRYRDLRDTRSGEPSAAIRERVVRARERQRERFAHRTDTYTNADMTVADVSAFCKVSEGGDALLRTAIARLALSARAYHRVLKVARTIADLDLAADIGVVHVSEAIQYRSLEPLQGSE